MRTDSATLPGRPDRPNEDFAAVGSRTVVVLDGVTPNPRTGTGCSHGVPWYARTLGTALLARLEESLQPAGGTEAEPLRPMADCLAEAIEATADLHRASCDLDHPATPSATVTAVRLAGGELHWLALADSSLLLQPAAPDGAPAPLPPPRVVTDDRVDRVVADVRERFRDAFGGTPPGPEREAAHAAYAAAVDALRNTEGGFWTAGSRPNAAAEALTGAVPLAELSAFALLTDGAGRWVELFRLGDWAAFAATLLRDGPVAVLEQVRAAEAADPWTRSRPRIKRHDDATIVLCRDWWASGGSANAT
ncbi:hypothetical protein [Allostreptomyces psammosilenae]|uniref:Uncharacterized protein n=1 Tax=Allostreptomyces psammosilenae TaxID=1892865 RepID=A0A853A097_9ACTN|nr:hypothetical protein [Allostreptomyces psammosilenae]NYI06354.1 hypothetical protein [Allostreptomyces psammosilenae]